jgi:hypothetical protein
MNGVLEDEIKLDPLLDDQWIKDFEEKDNLYVNLYNNDVLNIYIHFIYIDKENNIISSLKKQCILSNKNYLLRDELLGYIKHNYILNQIRYKLISILKYNFHLSSSNIFSYLKNTDNKQDYLTIIKNIDTIHFDKTIPMFQDLNDLWLVFYEKTDIQHTKNQCIKSDFYTNNNNLHSLTKKILLKDKNYKKKHSSTKRKTV